MTRIGAVIGLAGLLAACATAADKDRLSSEWGDCVAAAVARLDDGKTDPVSIAYGVAPACKPQYQRLSQAMIAENFTERGQWEMRQQMRDGEVQMIASAVLIHRQRR